jgi:hypothetical protein
MRREAIYQPPDRFALSRFIEDTASRGNLPSSNSRLDAAVAVFVVLGSDPNELDHIAQSDGAPALLRSRYIRYWIYRHTHCEISQVISTLAEAIDFAAAQNRDVVLPEWPIEHVENFG